MTMNKITTLFIIAFTLFATACSPAAPTDSGTGDSSTPTDSPSQPADSAGGDGSAVDTGVLAVDAGAEIDTGAPAQDAASNG
jgi:hypothetical protein